MTKENIPQKKFDFSQQDADNQSSPSQKPFWKRHFLTLFLLSLLVVSIGWSYFSKQIVVANYEEQITALKNEHELELKTMRAYHIQQLSNTLALAVRSEMIAENKNQVNQYFLQTLKLFDVEKVMLADPITGKIILSTNKKDEQTVFGSEGLIGAKSSLTKMYEGKTYAATPIMGLNTQLGVLIIQLD